MHMLSDNRFFFGAGVEFVIAKAGNLSKPCSTEGPVPRPAITLATRVVTMAARSLQRDKVETGAKPLLFNSESRRESKYPLRCTHASLQRERSIFGLESTFAVGEGI